MLRITNVICANLHFMISCCLMLSCSLLGLVNMISSLLAHKNITHTHFQQHPRFCNKRMGIMIVNISIIKYLKQPYDEFRVENSIKHFPRFRVTFQDLHSDVGYNSINVGCRPDNELKISLLALRRKVSLQTVNFIILPFRNFHFKRTGRRL